MTRRGCGCCTPGGNHFNSQGRATVLWKAPPCPYSNRIGIDVTIQNLSDCTDYKLLNIECGTCTRTFSNLNGTYYCPITIDETGGNDIGPGGGVTYAGQLIINVVLGQWYTGSSSCAAVSGSLGSCVEPSAYDYFKIEAKFECDSGGGLHLSSNSIGLILCDSTGDRTGNRFSATATNASTFYDATMRPDCCTIASVSPAGRCCNAGFLVSECNADSQGATANKFKFEWVTA